MKFRRDVNGLRAIAVIAVVAFHYGVMPFRGGFAGVDVFFVISGFLLTSIAHERLRSGGFSPVQFLLNRLRRIFPALLVVVLACWVWAANHYLPDDYSRLVRSGTAALLFRSNYVFVGDAAGYFGPDARSNILLHTWSLAVESQFYILFALACGVVWPKSGTRHRHVRWAIFAVLGLFSFAWCVEQTAVNQPTAFYLPWGRSWEFMAGSLAALCKFERNKRLSNVLELFGAVLLAFALFGLHGEDPYPGWRALLPVGGAALILFSGEGAVANLLCARPFQFLGNISYSVYLWHWPVLIAFKERMGSGPSPGWAALLIVVSIAAGWVSYLVVEQTTRRRMQNVSISVLFVTGVLAGFVFTGVLNKTDGLQVRLPLYLRAASTAMKSEAPRSAECQRRVDGTKYSPGDFCELGNVPLTQGPTIMLWGDSFANMIQPVVDGVASRSRIPGIVATMGGCPPFKGKAFVGSGAEVFPGCERYANFAFNYFVQSPTIKVVVVAGDWQRYDARYEGQILREIATILASRGGKMVLMTAVPSPQGDLPRLWARLQVNSAQAISKMSVPRRDEVAIATQGHAIADIAREAGNVILVDPFASLCDEVSCITVSRGVGLYKDTDHLTQDGVELLAPQLEKAISQAILVVASQHQNEKIGLAQ